MASVTDSVKKGLKGNKTAIAKDLIAGTTFGEAVVGQGDLGRLSSDPDIQKSLGVLRQGAEGFSSKEALLRKEKALEGIGAQTQASRRGLLGALGRAGVRGGAAGKQLRDIESSGIQARANAERDLFLAGEQARQSGAQNLLTAAQGVRSFDLGQAAKEKNIALQAGMGFASLGSAERAAFLANSALGAKGGAIETALGGDGGGGGLLGSLGGAASKGLSIWKKYTPGGIATRAATSVAKKVFKPVRRIFCHHEDTLVLMADSTFKPIKDLKLGDMVALGGKVGLKGDMINEYNMYEYQGELVTGSHYVLHNNEWVRVEEIEEAIRREDMDDCIICPIETENGIYVTEAGYISGSLDFEMDDMVIGGNYEHTSKILRENGLSDAM